MVSGHAAFVEKDDWNNSSFYSNLLFLVICQCKVSL